MSAPAEIFSLGEALEALASPDAHERFATAVGVPLLVVNAPAAADALTRCDPHVVSLVESTLASLACVTVWVGEGAESPALARLSDAFDVRASDAGDLAAIRHTVTRAPLAATVLAQLLRGSASRSIDEGLVAESLAYSTLQAGPEFSHWRSERAPKTIPADAAEGAVVCERADDTLHIELNRPARHNAFSRTMRDGLCEALDIARHDSSVKRVELRGRGPSFCSGGDLDEFGQFPDPATAHAIRTARSPALRCARLADRLHARVHGACLGAGAELPAFAHHVTATPDARFGLPEVGLGLVPGAGGTVSLPRRIGRQATAWLALTGEAIDAHSALALGLIDAIEGD